MPNKLQAIGKNDGNSTLRSFADSRNDLVGD